MNPELYKDMNYCTRCEVWYRPHLLCNCYSHRATTTAGGQLFPNVTITCPGCGKNPCARTNTGCTGLQFYTAPGSITG